MKKYISLVIIIFLLLGCSTNKYQKNYDLGIKYLEQGDYENAIISLNAAIEIDPKEEAYIALAKAYTEQGNAFLEQGDYDSAISFIYKSMEAKQNKDALFALAKACYMKEDYIEVINIFNQIYEKYGTMDFTERYSYNIFSELSNSEQQLIETICNATINGDDETLYMILKENGKFLWNVYTNWNKYKVYISYGYIESPQENAVTISPDITIEIRPENGMGYYCFVKWENRKLEYESYTEEDNTYTFDVVTCPCVNWQWNGKTSTINSFISYSIYNDPLENLEFSIVTTENGSLEQNFRSGNFSGTTNEKANSYYYNNEETTTYVKTYQNGMLIDYSGDSLQLNIENQGLVSIRGYSHGTIDSLEDAYNYIYW